MKRFLYTHRFFFVLIGIVTLCGLVGASFLWRANAHLLATEQDSLRVNAQIAASAKSLRENKLHDKQLEAYKKHQAAIAAQKAAAAAQAQKGPASQSPQSCDSNGSHMNPNQIDVIVNKQHCINPLNFTPPDLTTVYGAVISKKAEPSFVAMYQAAAGAGAGFGVTSSFRSYDNQVATYNQWVAVNGSAAAADTVSARPGYSEHQTGLAADLSCSGAVLEAFAGSACYHWLTLHAADYGFIERYPQGLTGITGYSPEAWHWRYVGTAVAKGMKASGVKTLEQYFGVTGGDY